MRQIIECLVSMVAFMVVATVVVVFAVSLLNCNGDPILLAQHTMNMLVNVFRAFTSVL